MKITFYPSNKQIQVSNPISIMEAAMLAGIDVNPVCGGRGTCGKCKVIVTKGNDRAITKIEEACLTREEIAMGKRLACQSMVTEETCVLVSKDRKKENPSQNVLAWADSTNTISYDSEDGTSQSTYTQKISLSETTPSLDNPDPTIPIPSSKLDELGIAMDIGTTSIAFSLWNVTKKRKFLMRNVLNPQRRYGADVISRITYCYKHPERIKELQTLLLKECNTNINTMLTTIGVKPDTVKNIVAVCNTTMSHILAGESVDPIAKAPVQPIYMGGVIKKELGLLSNVFIAPNIGGHVGSDALACIIATQLQESKKTRLIIDVGTNGELILCHQGKLVACSTAAGPAFEGANIECGMCATEGAIIKYHIEQGRTSYQVVGNVKPIGISGSGIIDAVAQLLRAGIIDETGRIAQQHMSVITQNSNHIKKGYILTPSQDSNPYLTLPQHNVYLTQDDIRQVQMAKAAIQAAIIMLLQSMSLTIEELDEVLLAGSFGSSINIANGIAIGLLPNIPLDRIRYIGNAALGGAEQLLLQGIDKENIARCIQLANSIAHIELAEKEEFNSIYIDSLNF